jgi:hypothetical protein
VPLLACCGREHCCTFLVLLNNHWFVRASRGIIPEKALAEEKCNRVVSAPTDGQVSSQLST